MKQQNAQQPNQISRNLRGTVPLSRAANLFLLSAFTLFGICVCVLVAVVSSGQLNKIQQIEHQKRINSLGDDVEAYVNYRLDILNDQARFSSIKQAVMHPDDRKADITDFMSTLSILNTKPQIVLLDFAGTEIHKTQVNPNVDFSGYQWISQIIDGKLSDYAGILHLPDGPHWCIAVPVPYGKQPEGILTTVIPLQNMIKSSHLSCITSGEELKILQDGTVLTAFGTDNASGSTQEIVLNRFNLTLQLTGQKTLITTARNRIILMVVVLLLLMSLLVALTMVAIARKLFVKPLQQLRNATRGISNKTTSKAFFTEQKSRIQEIALLNDDLKVVTQQVDDRKSKLEKIVETRTYKLNERVKELNCLHDISETVSTKETIEEILQNVIEIIPPAWQYPQITCTKITFGNKEFKTENFQNSQWKLSSDIKVNNKVIGKIEVAYLKEKPESDIGPFLNEERILLDTIADQLAHIIEKNQTEEEITQQNNFLNSVMESLTHPFYVIDVNDYSILQANAASGYIPGSSKTTCHALTHNSKVPCNTQDHQCPLEIVMKTHKPAMFEHIHFDKDGNEINVEVYGFPVIDENGEINAMIEYSLDITVHKQAEEKLKAANRQLETREKKLQASNKELQQFAYVASHDLKEPLRMVSSYTQLLERRYKDKLDDKGKKFINYAVDGAKRMQTLIDDLLSFSRISTQGDEFVKTDVNQLLQDVKKSMKTLIAERKAVVTKDQLPEVFADEAQLERLFANLVGNAIKYCDKKPEIHISAKKAKTEWIFSVKDNGIGIDKEFKEKIFIIFQRLHTKDKYPGTGIGLAISKRIINRHGGKIWFESEPGKGTTFYFSLPVKKLKIEN